MNNIKPLHNISYRQFRKTVLLGHIIKLMALQVLLDNECLIRTYHVENISCYAGIKGNIIMLSVTYYAQNYAGIISWSLQVTETSNGI